MSYEVAIPSVIAFISLIASAYVIGLRIGNRDMDTLKTDIIQLRIDLSKVMVDLAKVVGWLENAGDKRQLN